MSFTPRKLAGLSLLAATLVCAPPESQGGGEITIDATQRFQTVDGFGTALAWWSEAPYWLVSWLDMYYRDLGSSMLRVEMVPYVLTADGQGTIDNRPIVMVDDIDVNVAQFNFDHVTIRGFGLVAEQAKERALDEFKLIGSLWTPPHWLKRGATIEDNNSAGGHLRMDKVALQQFARYVAAYVKGFEQRYGVPFYAVSIQNELNFDTYYNSCIYTPPEYVAALKAVGAEFERQGIQTKLQGPEDVGVGSPDDPWLLSRQFEYINAVNADRAARRLLEIYSIHGYAEDGSTAGGSREMWRRYWDGNVPGLPTDLTGVRLAVSSYMKDREHPASVPGIARDEKRSWMTEASGDPHTLAGALSMANQMHDALVYGQVSAWLYWQTDSTNEPTHLLVDTSDPPGKKFAAFQHFSRWVRPGAVRVAASPDAVDGVRVSAWVHEKNRSLTVVLINPHADARSVAIRVPGRPGVQSFDVWRTSEWETFARQEKLESKESRLSFELPARSMLTLHGVAPIDTN
jgi:O-glycosyl hydrolase